MNVENAGTIERCTDEQLALLKKNQSEAARAAEACDAAALAKLDEEFHRTISIISGNLLLIEFNDLINRHLAQFRQNLLTRSHPCQRIPGKDETITTQNKKD